MLLPLLACVSPEAPEPEPEFKSGPHVHGETGGTPDDTGGEDCDRAAGLPVAVCEALPATVEAVHEDATWSGTDSFDPAGCALDGYEWTLTGAPTGSVARMPTGGPKRPGFTPDLVGVYEAELVVTGFDGERSAPCVTTVEAVSTKALWVEIFWTHSNDDLDLHLLRPDGDLVSNGDCYYANCVTRSGLDWGAEGDTSDNPILDIDDIPGTGPEVTNIDHPEAGTFTAYVHDYPGSVYEGANEVTMRVYIRGELAWTGAKDVDEEDAYVPFASIDMPDGVVTAL